MHALIRRIHLYCAFVLTAFVLMYFTTGYVLTRGSWFGEGQPTVRETTRPLDATRLTGQADERAFAAAVQEQVGMRGQRQSARRQSDGGWEIRIFRPGHQSTIKVSPDLGTATVQETRHGWQRTMIGFHRLHGYGHGWFYNLWAVLYDLASLSMIVFAITGVCLWYRLARDRWPGWILLAAGFAFTAASVVQFLVAR